MSVSTIHDIGYRHYDGKRLGRAYVTRSMFVHNLRATYGLGRPARAKVMPFVLAGIMMLPAVGDIAVVAIAKQPKALFAYTRYQFMLQLIISIFVATQAPVLASREIRFHVVPLYFSRPTGHLDFVLAKLGAFTTALFALTAVPITTLYIGGLVTQVPHSGKQLAHFLGGLAGCLLLSLVLAAIGMVVAAFTPRRGFGVAAVIAVLVVSSALVSILQGITEHTGHWTLSGWLALFTPFNLVDTVSYRLLGGPMSAPSAPPGTGGGLAALALCAAIVLGAVAVLYARFRKAGLS
ncbi:ABC transporter permease [Actinomadura rupiterrae]|uniref:ABC transporter permease n=1 Tax=Actinomadura rupiterrae TaxID=559627 RepID=UPI0020A38F52|nr:ABC transporter permease [Actinomadura rupiterrae]MCP2335588.1 ABC-2 type transport system permease protein [Actinomadura rupiterrae]